MAMPVMLSEALPVLLSVTLCAALVVLICWLPKFRLVGDRLTAGAGFVPVPVKLICCGLPEALSVMLMVPVRVPVAVGVNVTLIVQLVLTASELPQLLLWA